MAKKQYEHLFIENMAQSIKFVGKRSRGESRIPLRDRDSHGSRLLKKFDELWKAKQVEVKECKAKTIKTKDGTYLEFKSSLGYDLITKSLEGIKQGVRLLNIRTSDLMETRATIYIPAGKENYFVKKIQDYIDKDTKKGKPKNAPLVNSIEDISMALLEALWTDPEEKIPGDIDTWVEVWLRISEEEQINPFLAQLDALEIKHKPNYLVFPERAVVLIYANRAKLNELIIESDMLAEFRIGQETAGFWVNQSNKDQSLWVQDLLNRFQIEQSLVKVCILDSGVNNGHQLLAPVLADEDCLTVDPTWGTEDHYRGSGHGTLMAGIVAYGDFENELQHSQKVVLTHKLCSVKILPRPSQTETPTELWGQITQQAISRAEIQNPELFVLYCLAVTSNTDVDKGKPSSWSGAIDDMAYGNGTRQRLIIISGGNIDDSDDWENYPDSNLIASIQNPAQAWNALTVGAYTEKYQVNDDNFPNYAPVAPPGGLSPFSSTSLVCNRKWPIKPDIVFEGGNLIKDIGGHLYEHEDVSILSTAKDPSIRQFDVFNATSASAAKASWFAAKIAARYPHAWPETIRGLMVHYADWKDEMVRQFGNGLQKKSDYTEMLRIFGFGVPSIDKSLFSSGNQITYIIQETIQPFKKDGNSYNMNEMHFYSLPWPKDIFLQLSEMPIKLRITLSYYIQPGVGEIGWKDKYRYQSFGLRFDLNSETENKEQFKKRINRAVRDEDEKIETDSNSARWEFGAKNRNTGSIHSDIWEGTAAQIAACNMIAVYPVIGWWRERHNLKMYNKKMRYSLIVSLETPEIETDIYSVVENMVKIPIPIRNR